MSGDRAEGRRRRAVRGVRRALEEGQYLVGDRARERDLEEREPYVKVCGLP